MNTKVEQHPPEQPGFAVGDSVRIVRAPGSYGYNGRSAKVVAVSGTMITLAVDDHPGDVHCTIFYAEELEPDDSP